MRFEYLILLVALSGCKTTSPRETKSKSLEDGPLRLAELQSDDQPGSAAAKITSAILKMSESIRDDIRVLDEKTIVLEIDNASDDQIICDRPGKKTMRHCKIQTRTWPYLHPLLCTRIVPYLMRQSKEAQTSGVVGLEEGGWLKVTKNKENGSWTCEIKNTSGLYVNAWEKPNLDKVCRPTAWSRVTEKDIFADGRKAPSTSKDYISRVNGAEVALHRYKATDAELAEYVGPFRKDNLDEIATSERKLRSFGKEAGVCRLGEIIALRQQSRAGLKEMNEALVKWQNSSPQDLAKADEMATLVKITASAVRCMGPSDGQVLYRQLQMDEDARAVYKKGTYMVEPGFVLATSGSLASNASGNVEMHIYRGRGALLDDVFDKPEDSEVFIQAGTVFKVTCHEHLDDGTYFIGLEQIP